MTTAAESAASCPWRARQPGRCCIAVLILCTAMACRDPDPPTPADRPPDPSVARSAGVPADPHPMAGAHEDPGVDRTDLDFLQRAVGVGAFEVDAAKLARAKGTHPSVLAYAETMIRDHSRLAIALEALAAVKGLRLADIPDADRAAQLRDLTALPVGYDFDRRYGDLMQRSHAEAMALFRHARDRTRDTDVRDFADSALLLMQPHGAAIDLIGADGIARKAAGGAPSIRRAHRSVHAGSHAKPSA